MMDSKAGDKGTVLLIEAPYYALFDIDRKHTMPLGLFYIAAVLEGRGYDVCVYKPDTVTSWFARGWGMHAAQYDYGRYRSNLTNSHHTAWVKLRKTLDKLKPDYVGVSALTMNSTSAAKTAEVVKGFSKDIKVVAGGADPTLRPAETLGNRGFDYVVRGEGEYAMAELLDTLGDGGDVHNVKGVSFREDGGIAHNPNRELIKDLDELPFPAKDTLLEKEHYKPDDYGKMITGRGCPYNCKFCACKIVWGNTYRLRSPENVVDEMEQVRNTYGTKIFSLLDDTFLHDEKRVLKICDLIEERGLDVMWACLTRGNNLRPDVVDRMIHAGLIEANIGIESGSQSMLDSMNKGINLEEAVNAVKMLKEKGIYVTVNFIVGYPGETPETLEKTRKLIKEFDVEYAVELFKPFHGTRAYEELRKTGRLIPLPTDDHYDYYRQTFTEDSIDYKYLTEQHKKMIEDALKQAKAKREELKEKLKKRYFNGQT